MLHREAVLIGCMLLKMSHSYSVLDSAIRVNSKSRFLCFNFVHDFITGHYESLLPVNQIVSDSLKVIDGLIRWLQWSTKSIQFNICRARFSIWFESRIFFNSISFWRCHRRIKNNKLVSFIYRSSSFVFSFNVMPHRGIYYIIIFGSWNFRLISVPSLWHKWFLPISRENNK